MNEEKKQGGFFSKFFLGFLISAILCYVVVSLDLFNDSIFPHIKRGVVRHHVHVLMLNKEELRFMRQPQLRPTKEGIPTCIVLDKNGNYEVSGSTQKKSGLWFSFSILGKTGRYFNEILGRFVIQNGKPMFKADKDGRTYVMPGWIKGPGGRVFCRQFQRKFQWWKKEGPSKKREGTWWKNVK